MDVAPSSVPGLGQELKSFQRSLCFNCAADLDALSGADANSCWELGASFPNFPPNLCKAGKEAILA